MWPYIVLILCPIIAERLSLRDGKAYLVPQPHRTQFAMKLFWGIFLLLLMLRHQTVGRDLIGYQSIFQFCGSSNWQDALGRSAEIAFSALNKVIALYTDNFIWLQIIVAIICVVPHAKAYLKYSTDATFSICLLIILSNFVMFFSGLRQTIAISVGLIAFECVRAKKPCLFLGAVVVAMLFHTSAFMLLFMYPLYHMNLRKESLLWILPTLGVVFVFNRQIFAVADTILRMFTKYDAAINLTGAYTMLILLSLFGVFSYLIPEESDLDSDTLGMRNFLLFSIVLQMFAPLHFLAMRMSYYYLVFVPLLMPRIVSKRSKRWSQVAITSKFIMEGFFLLYFFLTAPNDNVLNTFPYHFFWEQV